MDTLSDYLAFLVACMIIGGGVMLAWWFAEWLGRIGKN
jgi:hypothetical protein